MEAPFATLIGVAYATHATRVDVTREEFFPVSSPSRVMQVKSLFPVTAPNKTCCANYKTGGSGGKPFREDNQQTRPKH